MFSSLAQLSGLHGPEQTLRAPLNQQICLRGIGRCKRKKTEAGRRHGNKDTAKVFPQRDWKMTFSWLRSDRIATGAGAEFWVQFMSSWYHRHKWECGSGISDMTWGKSHKKSITDLRCSPSFQPLLLPKSWSLSQLVHLPFSNSRYHREQEVFSRQLEHTCTEALVPSKMVCQWLNLSRLPTEPKLLT